MRSCLSDPVSWNQGVPQGSVLGPLFFTMFVSLLADLIERHDFMYHQFADDIQLYLSFNPTRPGGCDRALCQLSNCITDIRAWMLIGGLKLNDDKTEFLVFTAPHQRSK